MFEPQKDRVDYGKLLIPPDGFELDFAVGTTYSLDLDAFIAVCMSLGLSADTESRLFDNHIFMLDVLHRTSGKIMLFCEGGQIYSPAKVTPLYALLENSVLQISVNGDNGAFMSFHPKFWLISYKNKKGEKRYRLIVLSRNLTFDRSWDVVVSLDGYKAGGQAEKNRPVKDFLAFLKDRTLKTPAGKLRGEQIQKLIDDLDFIEFKTEDRAFEDFEFIPLGIGGRTMRSYPLFEKERYHELFIMSPFLSKTTVKEFNDRWNERTQKPVLITRRQSLKEVIGSDNFEVYCMRSEVIDGEDRLGEGNAKQQDIHAKLYMLRQSRSSDAELYLGSMNASHNAMYGNVEFMLRLKCKPKQLNLDMLKRQLFGSEEEQAKNPFEAVEIIDVEDETEGEENLDRVIKSICRSGASARVEQRDNGYDIVLDIACKEQPYPVSICPLFSNAAQPLSSKITFEGLPLKELSQFYKIVVKGKDRSLERIVVIPTAGLPIKERDSHIIASIVPDRQRFYAYLSFILADNPVLGALDAFRVLRGESDDKAAGAIYPVALYEKMLKVAATEPERLNGIDYLVKAVSNDGIVPTEFIKLYETFQKAVKRK